MKGEMMFQEGGWSREPEGGYSRFDWFVDFGVATAVTLLVFAVALLLFALPG